MNTRRNFLQQMILAGAGAMILPSATTYERIWRPKLITRIRWKINWGPIVLDPSRFGLRIVEDRWLSDPEYECIMLPPTNEYDRDLLKSLTVHEPH